MERTTKRVISEDSRVFEYPIDEDGEWSKAMHPGDDPIKRLPDGTIYDPNNSDHFSHPF